MGPELILLGILQLEACSGSVMGIGFLVSVHLGAGEVLKALLSV